MGRLRRHGDVNYSARFVGEGDTREQRFWSKTKRAGDCLEWQGARDKDGYGICRYVVDGQRVDSPHRMAFYLANGYFPEVVRHRCDNPPCCEPAHLRKGTHAENIRDKMARKRQAKGAAVAGVSLTEAEVRRIKSMQSNGKDRPAILKAIGHSPSAVRHVLDGHTWKHI